MSKSSAKKKTCKPRKDAVLPSYNEVIDRLKAGFWLDAGYMAVLRGCSREQIINLKCSEQLCDPDGAFVDCDVDINSRVMGWSRPLVFRLFPHVRALIVGDASIFKGGEAVPGHTPPSTKVPDVRPKTRSTTVR